MLRSVGNLNVNSVSNLKRKDLANLGVVRNVILSEDDPLVPQVDTDEEDFVDKDTTYIGAIRVTPIINGIVTPNNSEIAFPYNRNNLTLPVLNEFVELIRVKGSLFYKPIDNTPSPSITANVNVSNELDKGAGFAEPQQSTVTSYNKNSSTGIPRNNNVSIQSVDGYGEYYEGINTIHRLRLYEGDILFESRFGQSIRFNGYDGQNPDQNPTIFIRNRESDSSQANVPIGSTIDEDINRDGSSIVMSSGTRILNFLPGNVSDNSSNNFETTPDSVTEYPNVLDGDQILMTSDRIIISSRAHETLMFSKGNFGIITDENFSIDARGDMIISMAGNINVATDDNDITIDSGNGNITLGSGEVEPIVKGDQLVSLLTDLIDAIVAQTYATPSGPTSQGPLNQAQFRQLKTQLSQLLSQQTFSI